MTNPDSTQAPTPTRSAADVDAGTARCLAALGDRDPLTSFREAPERVARLLADADDALLARSPARGGWSVRGVIAHLADGEVMIGSRLRLMAAMERPTLVGYDQDAFVAKLGVDRRTARDWLELFRAMRALNVDLLERLPDDAWERTGWHAERGEESVGQNVRLYAGHDRLHEAQIERVLAEVRGDAR